MAPILKKFLAENAGKMLELADRFEIMGFYDEIVEFMASESCISALSVDDAIHLLMVVDKIQVNNVEVYKKLVSRLSRELLLSLMKGLPYMCRANFFWGT